MYYYRDKDAREIDIVLEHDGILNPLEIKKTSNPGSELTKVFALLDKASVPRGKGAISKCHHTGYSKCDGILIYGWVIDVPAGESQILAKLYLFLIRSLNCKKSDTIVPEWQEMNLVICRIQIHCTDFFVCLFDIFYINCDVIYSA